MTGGEGGSDPAQRELARWQRRLLPFLVMTLVATALFFFATSYVQFSRLETFITQAPDDRALTAVLADSARTSGTVQDLAYFRWKTDLLVEERRRLLVSRRASAVLLATMWTQSLGFITGMILAILGAAFIMAKLSEAPIALHAEGASAKAVLTTSSPGIVLAVLGTGLMVMAMTVKFSATIKDPVVPPAKVMSGAQESGTVPPPVDDFEDADEGAPPAAAGQPAGT